MAKQKTQIELKGPLDIADASKLQQDFVEALAQNKDIVIANEELEKVDTSVIQLLLALVKQAQQAGLQVDWGTPSIALLKTANLTGLEQELGLI